MNGTEPKTKLTGGSETGWGNCPKCDFNLDGGDIFEHFKEMRANGDSYYKDKTDDEIRETAAMYGWSEETPKRFENIIGIEIRGKYDGVSYWKCPKCTTTWNRWTREEEEITNDEE